MNESLQSKKPESFVDTVDVRELIVKLWAGKWLIFAMTFAGAVIAVIVALMLPNIYRAEAVLMPNNQEASNLSQLAARYSSIASLAGISFDTGSIDKTAIGLEILKSKRFISEFIERRDLLVPLIAATGWDQESRKLEVDPDKYDIRARKWVRNVAPPRKVVPSMQEAYDAFMDRMSINHDDKSGFITLSIEHYSAEVAKNWVDWLIEDLNLTIMRRDVNEAEKSIEYLNRQIENTSLAGMQSVFFDLIEEQTKIVMLASVSEEYILRTIDPAIVPELRAKPNRVLIAVLGVIIGGLLGVLITIVYSIRSYL